MNSILLFWGPCIKHSALQARRIDRGQAVGKAHRHTAAPTGPRGSGLAVRAVRGCGRRR
ncbi:hypothetical protein AWT69_001316 [Pseudomonas putida]|nr:hypothetical protein AWT69_001316 [Pseudomonas putida]